MKRIPLMQMYRCQKHGVIMIGDKACWACVEESKAGRDVGELRSEQWMDDDGKEVKQ